MIVDNDIAPATNEMINFACVNFHYAKSVPAGRKMSFAIFEEKNFIGVIIFSCGANTGYNVSNSRKRALNYDTKMVEFVRNNWNDLKSGTSPAKGYGEILIPYAVDENGDVIYKYNGELNHA